MFQLKKWFITGTLYYVSTFQKFINKDLLFCFTSKIYWHKYHPIYVLYSVLYLVQYNWFKKKVMDCPFKVDA